MLLKEENPCAVTGVETEAVVVTKEIILNKTREGGGSF
jgi:hypothetical protein